MAANLFGYSTYLRDSDGDKHQVGRLVVRQADNGLYRSVFIYAPDYQCAKNLPDLCPLSVPRTQQNPISIHRAHVGLPFALEDAVPDAWGRAVLIRGNNLSPKESDAAHLLRWVEDPMGALVFKYNGADLARPLVVSGDESARVQTRRARKDNRSLLEQKIHLALQFANNGGLDVQEIRSLMRMSTSSGGARPKFLYADDAGHWLVKPSVREDSFPMIRAEHLCLKAASFLGLTMPEPSRHVVLASNGSDIVDAILVRRFDVGDRAQDRFHMVSAKSLLGAESNTAGSYEQLSIALRAISSNPDEDGVLLFRWMLLNCAVSNVDDHLKNFSVLWGKSTGWRLSPAYDITPAAMANHGEGARYHSIGFAADSSHEDIDASDVTVWISDADQTVRLGARMGLSAQQVHTSVDAVRDVVDWMRKAMPEYGFTDMQAQAWCAAMRVPVQTQTFVQMQKDTSTSLIIPQQ